LDISFTCWFRLSGSSSLFSVVFIAAEVDGVGNKGSGDTKTVDVQTQDKLGGLFEHVHKIYLFY
jgi:hypothetical protein